MTVRPLLGLILLALPIASAVPQEPAELRAVGDSVTLHFIDSDLRAVVQALSRYLPKPVVVSVLPAVRVSLETPTAVPRAQLPGLLRRVLESQGLQYLEDSSSIRIGPRADGQTGGRAGGQSDTALVQLFVIRLKHARAADVAATVNLLFGGSGEFSGQTGFQDGTLSDELRRQATPPAVLPAAALPPDRPTVLPPASFAGQVTIVPDELTNALLVRSSPHDFEVLNDAVGQLDVRPLQVLIEVLVVEARRNKDFSFGTTLFVPPQQLDPGDNGTVGGETAAIGLGDVVIRLLNLGRANIDATLSASESKGNVRIVSRPVLVASNNTEASFMVGSQRPFVQVSRLLPTDNNNQDRVVQYRDVGTRLRVRPTINQDGYVSLVIQQEINAATSEVAFDAPVISTREAVTQVLVRDGQTLMLGGMRDQQTDQSRSGVPVLSGLPIIGGLFGSTSKTRSETELYLFITPRIIRTDEDADRLTEPNLPKEAGK